MTAMGCFTSALGHKRTCAAQNGMTALPPIATAKADSLAKAPERNTVLRSPSLLVVSDNRYLSAFFVETPTVLPQMLDRPAHTGVLLKSRP